MTAAFRLIAQSAGKERATLFSCAAGAPIAEIRRDLNRRRVGRHARGGPGCLRGNPIG
jgi:hypothetical protein